MRSGDIAVMSKESRLAYHGVPRIMYADSEPWNNGSLESFPDIPNKIVNIKEIELIKNENLWKPFSDYVLSSRININVREVLKKSCHIFS